MVVRGLFEIDGIVGDGNFVLRNFQMFTDVGFGVLADGDDVSGPLNQMGYEEIVEGRKFSRKVFRVEFEGQVVDSDDVVFIEIG